MASSSRRKRRTLVAPEMNLSLDRSEGSVLSDDFLETPDDLDINVDDIDTPDETDSLEFITNGNELEWEGQLIVVTGHMGYWDKFQSGAKHPWLPSSYISELTHSE